MDNTFRRVEKSLYDYYKDKKILIAVKKEIDMVTRLIDTLEENIRKCNVRIDPHQNGMGITEKVQTSSKGISYVENEIVKAIDSMKHERAQRIRKLYKLQAEERNLLYKIQGMKDNIESLGEGHKKLIDLRYNKGIKDMRLIAEELNVNKNKAYDMRDSIIESIALYKRNRWD